MKTLLSTGMMAVACSAVAQNSAIDGNDPLKTVMVIGDKLIRETPFEYKLTLPAARRTFMTLQCVDFGRSFGLGRSAVAYAYTHMDIAKDTAFLMQLDHNDGCRVWLNGSVVYDKQGDRKINITEEERDVELPYEVILNLKKGTNSLLIKSETAGGEWKVFMQPLPRKGAVPNKNRIYPSIGLTNVKNVDKSVAAVSSWLVVGPFANEAASGKRKGMDAAYAPESGISFGRMYAGIDTPITWTIPKVEVLGDLIDKKDWGTNYTWNYHNGGVAWAMQYLSEMSGDKKYNEYADRFCDFHLDGMPFVEYQKNTLNAFNSAGVAILNTPLLDFTLAPALPFIYRLRKEADFDGKQKYVDFINRMIEYARHGQVRLPDSGIYTRITPKKYTTWVDDMFMGIPFLVQASMYVTDKAIKDALMEDAAKQVLGFADEVWDAPAGLYTHARVKGSEITHSHWSRANGWAVWAMSDLLLQLSPKSKYYKPVMEQYRKHVESLVKLQDKSGLWHNVLDRPDSPLEVSGSAIFTLAIARGVTHGWLDAKKYYPVAMKGWLGVTKEIEPNGTVHKICVGTMFSENIDFYLNRPFFDDDTHGLFAVIFAGIETHKMLQTLQSKK